MNYDRPFQWVEHDTGTAAWCRVGADPPKGQALACVVACLPRECCEMDMAAILV